MIANFLLREELMEERPESGHSSIITLTPRGVERHYPTT